MLLPLRYILAALLLTATTATFAAAPQPPPWPAVLTHAKNTEAHLTMWSGSTNINAWIDHWVTPRLKDRFGITLRRIPVKDSVEIINRLIAEKQAGKTQGVTDLTWINGENFKMAKTAGVLYGPFVDRLPSYQAFYDHDSPEITTDFGTPVDGLEAPWGKAQFVFVYDSAKVKDPPRSYPALKAWVKAHPGRFTYPAPPDFTGSAFVRQIVYATTGGWAQYQKPGNLPLLERQLPAAWAFLNELRPYLWLKGTTYPETSSRLNQMFADGEVWMTMGYSPATAEADIRKGALPKTVRTFVMDEGSLANTHFLAIPFNAPHPDAAMVVADFLLSPEAQLAKLDPSAWGDFPALSVARLPAAEQKRFAGVDPGVSVLPLATLKAKQMPELAPEYLSAIEKGWIRQVAAAGAPR